MTLPGRSSPVLWWWKEMKSLTRIRKRAAREKKISPREFRRFAKRPLHLKRKLLFQREVILAAQEALLQKEIDLNARFEDLGGNSLVAAVLLAKVWEKCGIRLDLSVLSESTTLWQLIRYLEHSHVRKQSHRPRRPSQNRKG